MTTELIKALSQLSDKELKPIAKRLRTLAANQKITELAALSTMADTFEMTGVDTTDTSMAASGTNKKVAPSVMLPYFNLSPVGAKIATTADFTAAQTANITVMNFIGTNLTISLGNLTLSDTLTIYLSPGAGFSHGSITVDAGAALNIIGYDALEIASSGFPVGNGYIKRTGTISGAGFLYAKNIYSVPLSAVAFNDILSHTENCVIIDAGLIGTGLNLSVSGSISIQDKISTLMPLGIANVLTIAAGCTAINPELNLNTGGSTQIATVSQGGCLISPQCTSLVPTASCTILNSGMISSVTNDGIVTQTVTTSGTGIVLDSSSPSLVPTAAPATGGKQIASCDYVDAAIAARAITTPVSIVNGGTNSSTTLNNGRSIISVGGKIIEAAATNAQTGNYTLALTDFNTLVTLNSVSAITLTLPQQSTVATTTSFTCAIQNIGTSIITIVKEGSETLIGNITLPPGTQCIIRRPTTTSWSVFGGQAIVNMIGLTNLIQTVTDSTITLTAYAGCAGTILGVAEKADSLTTAGTFSIAINGVTVTGLSGVAPSTAGSYTAASALNTFARGNVIAITYTGTVLVANHSVTIDFTQGF